MLDRRGSRFALEVLFLAALAAGADGRRAPDRSMIVGVMALGWVVVALLEWAAWRDEPHYGSGLPPRYYVPQRQPAAAAAARAGLRRLSRSAARRGTDVDRLGRAARPRCSATGRLRHRRRRPEAGARTSSPSGLPPPPVADAGPSPVPAASARPPARPLPVARRAVDRRAAPGPARHQLDPLADPAAERRFGAAAASRRSASSRCPRPARAAGACRGQPRGRHEAAPRAAAARARRGRARSPPSCAVAVSAATTLGQTDDRTRSRRARTRHSPARAGRPSSGGTRPAAACSRADTDGIAHPTLPCGARIFVTYDGTTVLTQVVDRGPYAPGRQFDLTDALARRLGLRGVQTVEWSYAARGWLTPRYSPRGCSTPFATLRIHVEPTPCEREPESGLGALALRRPHGTHLACPGSHGRGRSAASEHDVRGAFGSPPSVRGTSTLARCSSSSEIRPAGPTGRSSACGSTARTIVDADAPGVAEDLRGLTLLEAAAVGGETLAGRRARQRDRPGGPRAGRPGARRRRDERRRRQRRRAARARARTRSA